MNRAAQALQALLPFRSEMEILTYPAEMGADSARQTGLEPHVLGSIPLGRTSAIDTVHAAREMMDIGAELVLFAGGDGTARDVYNAVGLHVPALGIPAGVKIHSAVYATHPCHAGELAATFLNHEVKLQSGRSDGPGRG